ncbi:MAG TPA: DUF4166 domain-containing protein [Stellaceae bacterium]|nr:DUF4166 domain-containing protein [Stellaceae bacterium]
MPRLPLRIPLPEEAPPPCGEPVLHDLRFRALIGAAAWSALPPAVRGRFSRRLGGGASVTYAGEIVESRMSRAGWLLAQLCRAIGGPLPLDAAVGVPAVVTVTEDAASGGQFWMRVYGRPRGFPQVIHSCKQFAGPTGLEEYLGCGFGIALRVTADPCALHFHSDHYFLYIGPIRLRLPRFLGPGELMISHVDCGDEWFAFVLALRHPSFGELIRQTGMFRERHPRAPEETES